MPNDDVPPPQSPKQRPTWLIWTIVGGAAALIAIAGIGGIIAVAKRNASDGRPPVALAPVDQLRSHLPAQLKPADVCEETSPMTHATATVACTWPSPHVPQTATYSLYDDSTAMHRSALTLVRGSGGYGPSCESADDFSGDGGQMQWQRDDRERGTMWCYLNRNGEPVILWTDTAPKILGSAVAPTQDQAGQLLDWFHREGQAELGSAPPPPPASTGHSPRTPSTRGPTTTTTTPGGPTTPTEPGSAYPQPEPDRS